MTREDEFDSVCEFDDFWRLVFADVGGGVPAEESLLDEGDGEESGSR